MSESNVQGKPKRAEALLRGIILGAGALIGLGVIMLVVQPELVGRFLNAMPEAPGSNPSNGTTSSGPGGELQFSPGHSNFAGTGAERERPEKVRRFPIRSVVQMDPTYTKDIAPLLQKHCQECHRESQIGPFPLMTYEQARRHAADIATVTADRRMPPWLAEPGFGPAFQHDRSLSRYEIRLLERWLDSGTPEGDEADLVHSAVFPTGWSLGKPDLVLELEEPFEIPADGEDLYRCFVIKNPLPEDAQIVGIEYQPENPRVVHHILGYVDSTGKARELDADEAGPGYACFGGPRIQVRGDLGGWAPGANASFLPDGIGRILPKDADIVLQVHYHPSGKPERDQSRVGLYLAPKDRPIRRVLHWWAAGPDLETVANRRPDGRGFLIPAGDSNHEIRSRTLPLPCDIELVAVSPHMHKLGKNMEMYAELPPKDGGEVERVPLIRVNAWDFNWQLQYVLEKPMFLPKGTVIHAVGHFDNSSSNPNNPSDPPVDVLEGESTTDEMCYGFFAAVKAGQDLTKGDPDDLLELFTGQLEEFEKQGREKAAP